MKYNFVAESSSFDPYYNLALEEFLLSRAPEEGCILYLWQNQNTVVIGKNQNPWAECRTSLLQEEGGHLARRLSGGGAVYHDLGNLNFTFLCHKDSFNLPKQLSVIQQATKLAGIETEFSGRNDLLANGRKFSGNAFYHSKVNSYHHGTLLIHTDMDKLQRYLSPPKAKLQSKGIQSVRSRVVNLKELSPALTCEKMKEYMIQAFSEIYGKPDTMVLSDADQQSIAQLRQRYTSDQWLWGRSMAFSCCINAHFSFGHLEILLQVENGIIVDLQSFTDAMDANLPQALANALTGCPFNSKQICHALSQIEYGNEIGDFIQQQDL